MRGEVIALDLETTGFDPDADKIIEVGVALCKDDEVIDQFQTLVHPGMDIPPRITAITGISTNDVVNAPSIDDVLEEIRDFIGSRPVIGHNIKFDLGFLARFDIGHSNQPVDTYELASVLLPTAPRYSLQSLVQQLDLTLEHAHRAYDDAVASWRVYRQLWGMLLDIEIEVLEEVLQHAAGLDWEAAPAFEAALAERKANGEISSGARLSFRETFPPADESLRRLKPNKDRADINVDDLAEKLEPGGKLASKIPAYEERPSQVEMLRLVADAFNVGDHLMVEAPTGTGKSLAYLLPAGQWAVTNNERVVIATHTINLQDQLLSKDIPLLQEKLGMDVSAAVLKGRSNYLCPRRLSTLRRRNPTSVDELRVLAKILVWLHTGGNGLKESINLRGGAENGMWFRLSAQDEGCTLDRCRSQMASTCPFFKARHEAEAAHLLVVNHALLLSDVVVGNRVIPEYRYLVLDEGHHLEAAVTDGLAIRLDKFGVLRKLADFGDLKSGMLGDLLKSLEDSVPDRHYRGVRSYVEIMTDAIQQMGRHVRLFFDELPSALSGSGDESSSIFSTDVRVTDKTREKPAWMSVYSRWEKLSEFTDTLSSAMQKIAAALAQMEEYEHAIEDYESLLSSVSAGSAYLDEMHFTLEQFVEQPRDNTIYWVSFNAERGHVEINAAPLHVGALVQQHLWEAKESIIVTSATLQTAKSFDYIDDRLNAEMVEHAHVATPFDYKANTLIYLPTDIPEPNQRQTYQEMLERGIIELATLTEGRMLCLFTSYTQLRQTAQAVAPRLALGDITVLDQSSGSSRQLLLDSFVSEERAVLMGTRSFWEGVDIPGQDLSALVIARLPFSVPSEPIFAARSEEYGDRSFMQYSIPDAILRFRQGFGRLIRRKDDRGVVAIFDKRVISKRYGQLFLDSLPPATVQRGPLSDLPNAAKKWLDL